ncbi:immunoglobulin domain-containing protein [Mycetocola sp. JXN-3]|uniref:immunoglobulin domain-containing protein n=1 Tax=Mycetocola sp. JXN-3 TaxID=2116510 RepID=UPI00165D241B|nr:immunoglobulin domain-containing protein [Mycetocola sp. JXN-3]
MPISRTLSAWSAAGVALALFAGGAGVVLAPATSALAAPGEETLITTATFEWGVNAVSQGTSNSGACSYFVAGIADGTDADYRTTEGNVTLLKRAANGDALKVTRDNRCLPMVGDDSRQRALFTAGTGQHNTATGEAHIAWTGAFTIYSYGGLVPWYIQDPVLDVDASGHGVIRATLGGSAGDPGGSGAVILELDNVSISGNQIRSTPHYAGVDYFPLTDPKNPASPRSTDSAISPATKAANPTGWGSWPTDMVDFHYRSGLTTYWHSSGGSGDAKKVPYGVTVNLAGGVPDYADIQPIKITQQPSGVQALPGDTVTLSAAATTNIPMTYQWQRANSWRGPWSDIDGATATSLVLANRKVGDAAYYRLSVQAGSLSATTSDAFVDVQALVLPWEDSKPRDRVVYAGSQTFVTSGFTGYPTPVYVPQLSRDGGATWNNVLPGDGVLESRSMVVDAVPADWDAAQYRTLARNGHGPDVVSSIGHFTVLPAPTTPTLRLNVESHPVGTRFDVTKNNDINVLGGGFGTPKTNLIYGIVPTASWNARGADYLAEDAVTRVEIEPGWNLRNGFFDRSVRPSAGTMKPGVDYSVVLLSATPGDRSLDAALALPLLAAVPDPDPSTDPSTEPSPQPSTDPSLEPSTTPTGTAAPSAAPGTDVHPGPGSSMAGAGTTPGDPEGKAGGLAHTGASPLLALGGAGLILALGAVMALRARRRDMI